MKKWHCNDCHKSGEIKPGDNVVMCASPSSKGCGFHFLEPMNEARSPDVLAKAAEMAEDQTVSTSPKLWVKCRHDANAALCLICQQEEVNYLFDVNQKILDAALPRNSKSPILVQRDFTATDDTVAVTLTNRGGTHGAFADNATIALGLRTIMRDAPNWDRLAPEQQLALEEIALKIGRILSTGSDPQHTEHWHDVIGYGTLGEKACVKK